MRRWEAGLNERLRQSESWQEFMSLIRYPQNCNGGFIRESAPRQDTDGNLHTQKPPIGPNQTAQSPKNRSSRSGLAVPCRRKVRTDLSQPAFSATCDTCS